MLHTLSPENQPTLCYNYYANNNSSKLCKCVMLPCGGVRGTIAAV